MSVYTLLNQNQLRDLLEFYEVDAVESISEISDGIENSNYLVKGWEQDYVLTIFEQASLKLEDLFGFMAYLEQEGKAVPCPIKNKKGALVSYFEYLHDRKAFILCKKLEGEHPKFIDEDLCEQLGQAFAEFHQLSENSDMLNKFQLRDLSFILPEQDMDFLSREKQQLFEEEKTFLLAINAQSQELPKGLCHCDFFPDNALVQLDEDEQKLSAFLDWYDAQHTYFLFDLAIIAISWCNDYDDSAYEANLSEQKITSLLSAYQNIRMLDKREIELWPAFLRIAAFRFWTSRELYKARMEQEGREINQHKRPDEFYKLLLSLRNT